MDMSSTRKATGLGLVAVLLWAALAALTALAGRIPPFQLAAMTFAIGTLVGVAWARLKGQSLAVLAEVPLASWCLGVYGLLAFHACYFFALQAAPPLEASLIIYLWPLLIVLMSGLLPVTHGGTELRWWHVGGALLGLAGTVLILMGKGGSVDLSGPAWGYMAAAAAALIWSSYSVASRLFARVPSTAVMGSCGLTAIGALAFHLLLETTVWPGSVTAWVAVLALGLGPVGAAFYLWDEGMKHGDIRLLGVASYTTPLFSTIILAVLGLGAATAIVWLAALLITAGALLASKKGGREKVA
jgi:drug/metabolite transporter (DMT)-like permease